MAERSRAKGVGGWLLRQAFHAPLAALLAATLIDLGPTGLRRFSPFPLALRVLDPFVWTCAIQSTVFATAVALGSLIVGSALGALIGRRSFWGRPLVAALVIAPLGAAPAFFAVGALGLTRITKWPVETGALGLESAGAGASWTFWLWTTLPAGVAWVALATARSYGALRPSWSDAARASGVGRVRAWWTLTRPLVRASAFRASAVVFVVALVEPGAPIVLGLRRTLGFQIVRQLGEPHPFPALAIWTAIALAIGALGSGLLRAWGGRVLIERDELEPGLALGPASRWGAIMSVLILLAWGVVAWAPAAGLAALAVDLGQDSSIRAALARTTARLLDPTLGSVLKNSATLGLGAAVVMLSLGVVAGRSVGLRLGADDHRGWSLSPLVVGVGVLAIGWLCAVFEPGAPAWMARALVGVARGLDPYHRSEPVMILGVAWGLAALVAWGPRRGRSPAGENAALQAARAAGFGRARARRLAAPADWGRQLARLIALAALAATNVAPALLFAPWSDSRTLGPAVVALGRGSGLDLSDAALLAILAVKINVLGLAAVWFAERPRRA